MIDGGLTAPIESGSYYIDIRAYDSTFTLIETGSVVAIMTASTFTSFDFNCIHAGISSLTILVLDFMISNPIPEGFT